MYLITTMYYTIESPKTPTIQDTWEESLQEDGALLQGGWHNVASTHTHI